LSTPVSSFRLADVFADRHIGIDAASERAMLREVGAESLDDLLDTAIPAGIRFRGTWSLPPAMTEAEVLSYLSGMASNNVVSRCFLGMGYHPCVTPSVILRNILENPQWYTPYTPYQAEISQGRLEALLNYQTLVIELTGLPASNASLLDESTAAAEAMTLCARQLKRQDTRTLFLVDYDVHPQTLAVLKTRAAPLGLVVQTFDPDGEWPQNAYGVLFQYPSSRGVVRDMKSLSEKAHALDMQVVLATDPLALCLLATPGDVGADIAVGSMQRFGMPMGFGGPHAAFIAAGEAYQRQLPGRIIGVSKDAQGRPACRLSLQTREQHIRRDKATSNICTAQALPAIVASMFAVYHGPHRLRQIALEVHAAARVVHDVAVNAGFSVLSSSFFDTVTITGGPRTPEQIRRCAEERGLLLRVSGDEVSISLHQATTVDDLVDVAHALGVGMSSREILSARDAALSSATPPHCRSDTFLAQRIFNQFHSETELMRYMDRLQQKDLGLTDSMIPLGSCTMKLNAATEMRPVTWPGFAEIHPFAPAAHTAGYAELTTTLSAWLAELTGFAAVSLQPNAGSQGEYAGLLAIRAYHHQRGEPHRDVCLIPTSAHGTNPASAVMAGLRVVGVKCDAEGNVDLADLRARAQAHAAQLSALMITYPSTHGVYEETIHEICAIVHEHGGQVYLDGANMNALVGLCRPGDFGADVCHLNLHKTFCIPHGGGGPGMGPIGVAAHLAPFLPGNPLDPESGAVSETPYGSGCILPISHAYIAMMGADGLARATASAILNANYIAARLDAHFPVLYRGPNGRVAHECILDCRGFKAVGVEVEDIAKRLMDYGFHAPTMSWPVVGTLMVEPTESESKPELDRFCDAMIAIKAEIDAVAAGTYPVDRSPLRLAPHTADVLCADQWDRPYSRELAAFPLPFVRQHKYWPPVGRVDNVHGDRHLVCTCEPVDAYMSE
jgi:glycine dehydrogenase